MRLILAQFSDALLAILAASLPSIVEEVPCECIKLASCTLGGGAWVRGQPARGAACPTQVICNEPCSSGGMDYG